MDPDIKIPYNIALLIIGAILVILGINGSITLGEHGVTLSEVWQRTLLALLGIAIIAISIWFAIFSNRTNK